MFPLIFSPRGTYCLGTCMTSSKFSENFDDVIHMIICKSLHYKYSSNTTNNYQSQFFILSIVKIETLIY